MRGSGEKLGDQDAGGMDGMGWREGFGGVMECSGVGEGEGRGDLAPVCGGVERVEIWKSRHGVAWHRRDGGEQVVSWSRGTVGNRT